MATLRECRRPKAASESILLPGYNQEGMRLLAMTYSSLFMEKGKRKPRSKSTGNISAGKHHLDHVFTHCGRMDDPPMSPGNIFGRDNFDPYLVPHGGGVDEPPNEIARKLSQIGDEAKDSIEKHDDVNASNMESLAIHLRHIALEYNQQCNSSVIEVIVDRTVNLPDSQLNYANVDAIIREAFVGMENTNKAIKVGLLLVAMNELIVQKLETGNNMTNTIWTIFARIIFVLNTGKYEVSANHFKTTCTILVLLSAFLIYRNDAHGYPSQLDCHLKANSINKGLSEQQSKGVDAGSDKLITIILDACVGRHLDCIPWE
ncbi:hypothetical protein CAPTEDRAFT_226117 [Capitella teleta]|uniref:Uncharacterized protein n=1 Tax=Capitella teleta TaxID=283909 RepID=R7TRE7_CAPTE|nr:hypothetical protein CAPTEDRAFT_226117 [Capitella teleta]|eukprot:ELT96152.1 hypothetical protein CAPTEDRAFT_226117 [Capitella teleta]